MILGVSPNKVQDPAFGLVEHHKVHTGPPLQLLQVPLHGIPSFWCVNCIAQFGTSCKVLEGALNPTPCVINEDI